MKHPLVKKLEEKLLPEFREVAEKINQTFENISANIESHSLGSGEHLGHSFYISCLIKSGYLGESDLVDLGVVINHLTTSPRITADVCWGHPSGYIEAEFSDKSLEITDEVLEKLYSYLPKLYEATFKALERRKPADEC